MKITKEMHEDLPQEHPKDRALRIAGEKYGRTNASAFCARHAKKMERLIGSYPDADAETLLQELRELFWAVPLDVEEATP